MRDQKKQVYLLLGIGGGIILITLWILLSNSKTSITASVEIGTFQDTINFDMTEDTKMNDFITSHLHSPDVFYHSHTSSDLQFNLKDMAVNLLVAGIKKQDVDLFLSAFTAESIGISLEAFQTPEERTAFIVELITNLSRNNTLDRSTYRLLKNQYNIELDAGFLNFIYEDGTEYEIPFKLIQEEKNREVAYLIDTPLIEFTKILKN